MKKIIRLSETELDVICNLILEDDDDDDDFENYDDLDFYDAFLFLFKEWIKKKIGDDYKNYPTSFLIKKYGKQFEKEMEVYDNENNDDEDEEYDVHQREYDRWRLLSTAKGLIKKGKYSLPSLNTNVKFTERYKKALPFIYEHVNFPKNVKVEFVEKTPNRVTANYIVDFPKYIMEPDNRRVDRYDLTSEIKEFMSGFLGVEFGNPTYGGVELGYGDVVFVGFDEWVKEVLNKKIKKEIKNLPNSNLLHSIRFSKDNYGDVTLKLVFKDSYLSRSWSDRREFKDSVEEYLKSQGYNTRIFKVDY